MASLRPANSTISSNRLPDGLASHPEHAAVEEDVLPARQFGLDAAGDTEQRTDPALHVAATGRLVGDLADDLQQRRLARAVDADQRQATPRADLEVHVLQDPPVLVPAPRPDRVPEPLHLVVELRHRPVGPELLPDVLDLDGPVRQCRQSSPPAA